MRPLVLVLGYVSTQEGGQVHRAFDDIGTPLWSLRAGRGQGRAVLACPLAARARADGRERAGGDLPIGAHISI